MDLSIIIPARNEEPVVYTTLQALSSVLANEPFTYEILVVDDGSTDATHARAADAQRQIDQNIRVISNAERHGFGRAIQYGLNHTRGRYIIIYMADASDSPRDVLRYYHTLNSGVDCVFGSRFLVDSSLIDYPLFKLCINRLVNTSLRFLFHLSYNDITNAFKGYNAAVIRGCSPLLSPHFNLTVELPLKAIIRGYTYAVIPISWTNRRSGVSSFHLREMGSRYLYSILICYFEYLLTGTDYHR